MRAVFVSGSLLLACGVASAAHAQAPHALNGPLLPSVEAERLRSFEALLGQRSAPPDTTSPWRYYPLHVGDAWEYYEYGSGDILRREINRDTTFNGHRYFVVERFRAANGGPLEPDFLPFIRVRFDTTSALVLEPFTDGSGIEIPAYGVPCPFDADFGTVIDCPREDDVAVTGGHDGLLVFGGDLPGTGEDTLRVTWKEYARDFLLLRYAADIGEAYVEMKFPSHGLYYARVDGVEYGVPRYPTVAEPVPELEPEASLSVWPNPAREKVSVAFTPEEAGPARLEVHDVRGRRVLAREVMALPGVRAEVTLDFSGLAPGVYVVRLVGLWEPAPTRLTVLR
jgi:hypothetical protein